MEKQQKLKEIIEKLQEDPYIRLPVDQKAILEFDELVVNNLDEYKKRKLIFKNDPEQKPLQLLIQFNYEVLTKDHFRILIEIMEFLSIQFKNEKPKNNSYFLQIQTVLQHILQNFLEDIKKTFQKKENYEIKLEVIQQAKFFINCLNTGGFGWEIHYQLKNFIQKYDQKTGIIKIIQVKFDQLKKQFDEKVEEYKKQNKYNKMQKKNAKQLEIIQTYKEINNETIKNQKDLLFGHEQNQIQLQKTIIEPTDDDFEEQITNKKIKI